MTHKISLNAPVINSFPQPAATVKLEAVSGELIPYKDMLNKPIGSESSIIVPESQGGDVAKVASPEGKMDHSSWNLQVVGLCVSAHHLQPQRGRRERGSTSLRRKDQHLVEDM